MSTTVCKRCQGYGTVCSRCGAPRKRRAKNSYGRACCPGARILACPSHTPSVGKCDCCPKTHQEHSGTFVQIPGLKYVDVPDPTDTSRKKTMWVCAECYMAIRQAFAVALDAVFAARSA